MNEEEFRRADDLLEREAEKHATGICGSKPNPPHPAPSIILTAGIWMVFLVCFSAFGDYHVTASIPFQVAIPVIGLCHYFFAVSTYRKWISAYYDYHTPRYQELSKRKET